MSRWGLATALSKRSVIASAGLTQQAMDAADDDIEAVEDVVVLVEGAVGEDVALDAGEDAEGRHDGVDLLDQEELLTPGARGSGRWRF